MDKSTSNINIVIEHILNLIKNGTFTAGSRIPSENYLSTQFDISRTTVREALKILQYIGLLSSTQGSGYHVNNDLYKPLRTLIRLLFKIQEFTYKDIRDIREALELKSFLLIKETSVDIKDIDELNSYINKMSNKLFAVDADISFHQKLAQLSGNTLIVNINMILTEISEKYILIPWDNIDDDDMNRLIKVHQEIVNALSSPIYSTSNFIKQNPISKHYSNADQILKKHKKINSIVSLSSLSSDLETAGYNTKQISEILFFIKNQDKKW